MSESNILRPDFGGPKKEKPLAEQIADLEVQIEHTWKEAESLEKAGRIDEAVQKSFQANNLETKRADLQAKLPKLVE
jgi:hypothetical protein